MTVVVAAAEAARVEAVTATAKWEVPGAAVTATAQWEVPGVARAVAEVVEANAAARLGARCSVHRAPKGANSSCAGPWRDAGPPSRWPAGTEPAQRIIWLLCQTRRFLFDTPDCAGPTAVGACRVR